METYSAIPDFQFAGGTQSDGTRNRQAVETGNQTTDRVAWGLGWFSIGLGLAEVIAPEAIGKLVGVCGNRTLIQLFGLREIVAGVGILTSSRKAGWLWARVAGDALDLAALGGASANSKHPGRGGFGVASVAGVTALDIWCAQQLTQQTKQQPDRRYRAQAAVIVDRSLEECYSFWRDLEGLPRFMTHISSVRVSGDRRSHWIATLAGNVRTEWDAELVDDTPNRLIAWRSLPGSDVTQAGSVGFKSAPGGRGTIVEVSLEYSGVIPAIGAAAAVLIGKHPEQMIYKELRRFKQAIETGEVITTEGQPAGRRSSVTWLDHIAR